MFSSQKGASRSVVRDNIFHFHLDVLRSYIAYILPPALVLIPFSPILADLCFNIFQCLFTYT